MSVWWAAATVFVLVLAGLLAVTLFAFGVRCIVREVRDGIGEIRQVLDIEPQSDDLCAVVDAALGGGDVYAPIETPEQQWVREKLDFTQMQRAEEIARLNSDFYMPPVIPGRD